MKQIITNIHSIAENFNKYFTEIKTCLTKKIDPPNKHFHEYFKEYQTSLPENFIFVNELKDTFFSSKITKTKCSQKVFWGFMRTSPAYF